MASNPKWSPLSTEGKPIKQSPPASPYTISTFYPSPLSKGKDHIHQPDEYTLDYQSDEANDEIAEPQAAFLLPSHDPYADIGLDVLGDGAGYLPYYTVSGDDLTEAGGGMCYGLSGLSSLPMQHQHQHPSSLNQAADGSVLDAGASAAATAAKFVYMSERAVERRRQRMIKNRESAARSRARRQAYDSQLATEIKTLKEANEKIEKEMSFIERLPPVKEQQHQKGKGREEKKLRRTSSNMV